MSAPHYESMNDLSRMEVSFWSSLTNECLGGNEDKLVGCNSHDVSIFAQDILNCPRIPP